MGNNPSSAAKGSEKAGSQSQSGAGTLQRERTERRRHHQQHTEQYYGEKARESATSTSAPRPNYNGQGPRQRESLTHLSSSAKAQAAPPSLTSAVAQSTNATSSSHARDIPTASSRSRSGTESRSRQDQRDAANVSPKNMGADQSRLEYEDNKNDRLKSPPLPSEGHTSPASQPVDVPSMGGARSNHEHLEADDTSFDTYQLPPNSFSRPPRLPLPIEEEIHNPGSPIVSPQHLDDDDEIPRRSSVVSSTVDDDEEPDNFEGYSIEHAGPKVQTIIEWRPAKHNDRVYVTGTFTNWERKFRLYRDGPSKHKDALSATLQLPPGTHHIKFIANGDMVTSEALPTTVDYTNILVNYIEVSLDQVKNQDKSLRSGTTTPTPVPAGPPAPSRPLDIRPKPVDPDSQPIPNFTAPQDPPHKTPVQATQEGTRSQSPKSQTEKPRSGGATLVRQPPKNYTSNIPQYLLDLDTYIPSGKELDTSPAAQAARYRIERANAAADSQPAPPSLPMFLSKSILNGTTPMKDDSSVLIMPNHTVLNHLATTNIKQGVLATSATTRYKRKVCTTTLFYPRAEGERIK